MKTILFNFVLITSISISLLHAQPERFEKIEAYKTKFLTEELDLSPTEAQKFWPVYNSFHKKLKAIEGISPEERRQKMHIDIEKLSDEELEQDLQQEFDRQKKLIQLRQDYYPQFKKTLGTRKAVLYYRAEHKFHRRLLRELGKRSRKRRP